LNVLLYLERMCPEDLPYSGHSALGNLVVAASMRRSASAEIQIKRNKSDVFEGLFEWSLMRFL
jgi:hypothetical protein